MMFIWNRHEEAIVWYDKALKVAPKDTDSLGNKGISLYRMKRYTEALELFNTVLSISPNDKIALQYKFAIIERMQ